MTESSGPAPFYFIEEATLRDFLKALDRGVLFATVAEEEGQRSRFERIAPDETARIALRCGPAIESAKSFLFPAKERVAIYPGGPAEPETRSEAPQVLLGVRACDLAAVALLDQVLREGDFEDPFYARRREHTLLISTDCVRPAETCFCNLVGGKPYADDASSDLNLTPVEGGYVVAIGTQTGRELVVEQARSFREATPEHLRERERVRSACLAALEEQNAPFRPRRPLQAALGDKDLSMGWLRIAASCVECGGCSYVCPTCHCFLLYDQMMSGARGVNERLRAWDSCLLGSFARMAGVGGVKATPRPQLARRFENRIRHKFEWIPRNFERLGCVGCGRCTEVCLGRRDVRQVIKDIGG